MADRITLRLAINQYDAAYRALGHYEIPSGPNWDADQRRVDGLGRALLAFECRTHRQYLRWYRYIQSVPDLRRQVSPEQARAGSLAARTLEAKAKGRALHANTTYEFGIEGSDRVATVPAGQPWSRHTKRYPFDIMEVGESVFLPGVRRRSQIGPALKTAERTYARKFTSSASDGGLRIRRVS